LSKVVFLFYIFYVLDFLISVYKKGATERAQQRFTGVRNKECRGVLESNSPFLTIQ